MLVPYSQGMVSPSDPTLSRSSEPRPEASQALEVEVLQVPLWRAEGWLLHGFSTRAGGLSHIPGAKGQGDDLNLGYTAGESQEIVATNRQRYLEAVGFGHGAAGMRLVTLRQMHSAIIRKADSGSASERATMWGDGLITDDPGIILGIQTADCLPILIADNRLRAVAAVHAGWRGTLKGIVREAVTELKREFGSRPEDLSAAIGPGIGRCCFEIGPEVRQLFRERFSFADELFSAEPRVTLDLPQANRRQLLDCGVRAEAIFRLDECTSCGKDRFFSYRAEHGRTGRMLAVIGLTAG